MDFIFPNPIVLAVQLESDDLNCVVLSSNWQDLYLTSTFSMQCLHTISVHWSWCLSCLVLVLPTFRFVTVLCLYSQTWRCRLTESSTALTRRWRSRPPRFPSAPISCPTTLGTLGRSGRSPTTASMMSRPTCTGGMASEYCHVGGLPLRQ